MSITIEQRRQHRLTTIENSLARRHRQEKRFRFAGLAAVVIGLTLVTILFISILMRGVPAFWQSTLYPEIYFDPEVIQLDEKPERASGESQAAFDERYTQWLIQAGMVNWQSLIDRAMEEALGVEVEPRQLRDLRALVASDERFSLRDQFVENPSLLGQTVEVKMLAAADVDVWIKGNIDRSLPDSRQQLSAQTREWADRLYDENVIRNSFSTSLFLNTDSRSSPASAGLAGAFMGSLFMMLIVIVLSVPIGVASAIYLEEFAPKNRLTDLVEININNLAAVPSIVFGLLGASIFIGYLGLPLSAPLVGGLVLTLMTLPTIIIATRASLRSIPPSIRQAALGIGASRVQTVFHHVLPLALPGILTGSILGVAQALGETAPLLLIGMNAFVSNVPATPLDQSAALPVQIYLWQGNELRNFFEARTSAAIIVLLGLMLSLNALAIWLRKKFETRW
ncbi:MULTISPECIES: phosphate ABC transporter permease PstA [Halomonadaceae]|jgi:phosphate transport system permease protein|uniref:Phosphate transport system permease protein PstA n=1 Tax=Vreelandella piezotolerans TaxID=2609667 RepID=A0ABQ6XE04_9GAMM|nr:MULTISPECIES: phosphate ABC transporter permease PstA [Halomonas]KAE8440232.1 phosphate ABC transporter permease PstA [Halomonas piezotolerans]MCG7578336.1 phosphate ABC transporter permease PstA [Halomonas sp. MMH1-48]MCG7605448.1 phosphate ABC transporter permease PstA [Halomonas sp. MM17-34]MCG7614604.1 phosphate ABC transporter permease PstA [Halomonas sp. MM17-29]MCG7621514.1 phosphate ABC transporter permease PstA [Halomonas sp. DSH1-27]|tara:strand:- start:1030 stop:2388 length:1359 start_codon:yes stop_codon:yes gene_type:complete